MMNRQFLNRVFYFTLFLNLFTNSTSAQWQNIGPGGGSDLQSIAVNPLNPQIVYIGGDIEGIFKTTDGGENWANINHNIASGPWTPDVYWTNEIKFDISDNTFNTLFLCTAVALFKTTNAGSTWEKIFPTAVTSESDFISVYSIGQNPNNSNELYLGTEGSGVFKSTNGGATWAQLSSPIPDSSTVYGTIVTSNGTVFIGSTNGIYSSNDGGATWTSKNSGLPHNIVWNLKSIELSGQRTLFATLPTIGDEGDLSSFQGGIFKSTNDGQSWTDITGNLPRMQTDGLFYYYWKFTVNPSNPNSIFIGTSVSYPEEGSDAYDDWGIYKTTDGGNTWTRSDINVNLAWMDDTFFDERHALVLAMAPSDSNTVYWGRDWMNKTTNAGQSWTQIYSQNIGGAWKGTGLELMMVETIAFSPIDQNKIFIGYDDMGPFRSDDNANSFTPLDPQMDPYDGYDAPKNILIDPANGDIYMSRYDGMGSAQTSGFSLGRIYKSTDNGATLENISTGFPDGRPDLAVDFSTGSAGNRTLYATSFGNGVYKSTNSGNSWTAINNGLGIDAADVWDILINPNNTSELFVGLNKFGGGGALYKSTNAGSSWSKLNNFPAYDVLCLTYDKINAIIYAGTTENFDWSLNGGIYKSTDGGINWSEISDLARVVDISIHPSNPEILFVAVQSWYSVWQPDYHPGIYRSDNGGNTWNNITSNLSQTFVTFATLNPNNPNQLFVGTGGGGLWVNNAATDIVETTNNNIPAKFYLGQNYPNPFNPTTRIRFDLPEASAVTLTIYNIRGQAVRTLVNRPLPVGYQTITWDGQDNQGKPVSSGAYLYRITAGDYSATHKLVLLR